MGKYIGAIGLAFTLALCDAHAEDLNAARACTRLGDDAARLACYDAALATPKPPGAPPAVAKTPVVVNAPAAQAQFGDEGQLRRDARSKADLPKTLTGQVRQVAALPDGRYRLTLDNGQTWRTTDADWAIEFKTGDTVTIFRLPLGGYQISPAGKGRSIGAQRIQ